MQAHVLKAVRTQANMSQSEFAARLGVSRVLINQMERGSRPVSERTARRVTKFVQEYFGLRLVTQVVPTSSLQEALMRAGMYVRDATQDEKASQRSAFQQLEVEIRIRPGTQARDEPSVPELAKPLPEELVSRIVDAMIFPKRSK